MTLGLDFVKIFSIRLHYLLVFGLITHYNVLSSAASQYYYHGFKSFFIFFTLQAPVMLSPHSNSSMLGPFRFQYFNMEKWKTFSKFSTVPQMSSLIAVHGRLYSVGGLYKPMVQFFENRYDDDYDFSDPNWAISHDLLRYDAEHNQWKSLPSMRIARHNVLLTHMSGYIYAIGGLDEYSADYDGNEYDDYYDYDDTDLIGHAVERFDLKNKRWEDVPSLPQGYRWTSAVTFQGHLMVYGVCINTATLPSDTVCRHVIAIYNSVVNRWEIKLTEHHRLQWVASWCFSRPHGKCPLLDVQGDTCYRVLYELNDNEKCLKASVNKLQTKFLRSLSISMGEAVPQESIPNNNLGAFRIEDKVYANMNGSAVKIKKLENNETQDVNLDAWKSLQPISLQYSNGVLFTFDKKRVDSC